MVQADVQEKENLSVRTTFHVSPTMQERIDRAVFASPWDQPAWLRHVLGDVLTRAETAEFEGSETTVDDVQDTPLAVQLAAARAQITGLEQINSLLTERLGMADAHNMELAKNLNITLGTVDRFTLALPAPREAQAPVPQESGWWPFRKKRSQVQVQVYIEGTPTATQIRRVD